MRTRHSTHDTQDAENLSPALEIIQIRKCSGRPLINILYVQGQEDVNMKRGSAGLFIQWRIE